jgi:DNA-binding transcriptional regulator YiaG
MKRQTPSKFIAMTSDANNKSNAMKVLEKLNKGPLTFGQLILSIREGEELSQEEFGQFLGLSKQKVCDYEKERRLPSSEKAAEFARKLGYVPESFAKLVIETEIRRLGLKLKVNVFE